MKLDLESVLINVRAASTEDLLERCTVFREGMELDALDIIEEELYRRGIDDQRIQEYARNHAPVLEDRGLPLKCSFCQRAAVSECWAWHRLWGRLPLFPRKFRYCAECAKK